MGFFGKNVQVKDGYGSTKEQYQLNVKRVILSGVAGFALFILLINILMSIRTVDAGEVGIVKRFGEISRIQESGLTITMPFIETMEVMQIRLQKEEQSASAATSDLQDVNAMLAVNYALDNESALKVYKELGLDYTDKVINPAIQETFKVVSAKFTASELITRRPEAKQQVVSELTARLEKYGIRVVDVSLTDFKLSKAFNDAIEAKQVAQQNAEKAKQDLERIKVEAEQAITKARGEAESQRLQQQTLTSEMLQKMAIEKWNGVMPTTVTGESTILSIPIK